MMQASRLLVVPAVPVVLTRAEMPAQLLSPFKVNVGTAQPGNSKVASATAQQRQPSTAAAAVVVVPPQQQHALVAVAAAEQVLSGLRPKP
jgi:hypothetical protein